MTKIKKRDLTPGYASEVDILDADGWHAALQHFQDASIYQTWPYVKITGGQRPPSHLVLRKNGEIVAMALVRIEKIPLLKIGVAYIRWGPVWRLCGTPPDPETFRQSLRALRNEYACRRGLVLRLFPVLFEDSAPLLEVLQDEGFASVSDEAPGRTILMDLAKPLEELHAAMAGSWKRNLKLAERKNLEVVERSDKEAFDDFIAMYKEMVSRKKFVEPNDIHQFKSIQSQLPREMQMRVKLCKLDGQICAGVICSSLGNTAIYLFGATSDAGMKTCGSHLLHWKLIQDLKRDGVAIYNLHGINPVKNPGTYKFKSDMAGQNGRDIHMLGRFDTHESEASRFFVEFGGRLQTWRRRLKETKRAAQHNNLAPKPTG